MPLMPPGNRLFRAYFDASGKLHAVYDGPAPRVCTRCGRLTYRTERGNCPWGPLCQRGEKPR